MLRTVWLMAAMLALPVAAFASGGSWSELPPVAFGDGLALRIRKAARPGPVFFIPHDNENVAVQAVEQLNVGTLVELQQQTPQIRYVFQTLAARRQYADPNRIYTAAIGQQFGYLPERACGLATPRARGPQATRHFAALGKRIVAHLQKLLATAEPRALVAVHNNTPESGPNAASIDFKDFRQPGYAVCRAGNPACGLLATPDAKQRNPNNFFLVTDAQDFRLLALRGWHVVLQKPGAAGDDASLSYWATAQQPPLRYINVEAEQGSGCPFPTPAQVATQVRMLRELLLTSEPPLHLRALQRKR